MNDLSRLMQDRLDKWRKNAQTVPATQKLRQETTTRRGGKGDHGDVATQEEWEEETKKSQTRR